RLLHRLADERDRRLDRSRRAGRALVADVLLLPLERHEPPLCDVEPAGGDDGHLRLRTEFDAAGGALNRERGHTVGDDGEFAGEFARHEPFELTQTLCGGVAELPTVADLYFFAG